MRRSRITRILHRSPGEVAFDRCLLPLAALFVLGVVIVTHSLAFSPPAHPPTGTELASAASAPAWPPWLLPGAGLVIAFFWLRGLVSVVRAWRDPSARVLRFSALGLLIPLAVVALRLLRLPVP